MSTWLNVYLAPRPNTEREQRHAAYDAMAMVQSLTGTDWSIGPPETSHVLGDLSTPLPDGLDPEEVRRVIHERWPEARVWETDEEEY